jgi:hypothetical protein
MADMSFKSRYLEAENARLRAENRTLLACLLERAGHRVAADMLKQADAGVLNDGRPPVEFTPETNQPIGRGWRAIRSWLQQSTQPKPAEEKPNGESAS